jgi:deoxyribonuclease V
MFASLDVSYPKKGGGFAACTLWQAWTDEQEVAAFFAYVPEVAPYVPGQFYKRELPCLLAVLEKVTTPLDLIVVDGYVWLSHDGRKGIGAYLYEALGKKIPVIAVAKSPFCGSRFARKIERPKSKRPLFVTAIGVDLDEAVALISQMQGKKRIPTLLARVDMLSKESSKKFV